jgi:diaminopimelate decarboxylase
MSTVKPVHALQTRFPVHGDELQVGGIDVSLLAERVGSTPFFAYDRALLSTRVAEVRAALPLAVRLHYSIKANPMAALVQHMAGLVDGLDVASAQELRIALDAGCDPAAIALPGLVRPRPSCARHWLPASASTSNRCGKSTRLRALRASCAWRPASSCASIPISN